MKTQNLRLISSNIDIHIKALDGTHIISNSKVISESGLLGGFSKLPGVATEETLMQVHEVIGDSSYEETFKSLPGTWSQKWVSQNQLIDFCENMSTWLSEHGTCFLVKKDESEPIKEDCPNGNLYIARIQNVGGVSLVASCWSLNYDGVAKLWNGTHVISPKLAP